MKIVVGMSGGVDSSVAAAVLKEAGHDVVGVTMTIWRGQEPAPDAAPVRRHACYGPGEGADIAMARAVCDRLGIPYHVFDCAEQYERLVLDYFKAEYTAGRIPNPCVRCNQLVKLGLLPELARKSGVDFELFATGHYARIDHDASSGRWRLMTAANERKDQSYFLYRLTQSQLRFLHFPLGGLTKEDVRAIARRCGLEPAEREESQDFYCGDYADLLGMEDRDGSVVNTSGVVVGRHKGFWRFTPGQRKGINISHTSPYYVVRTDAATNTVVVGSQDDAMRRAFTVKEVLWSALDGLAAPRRLGVRIRSTGRRLPGLVEPHGSHEVEVTLDDGEILPPGQSAVFYDGDIIIGGGVIDAAT